MPFTGTPVVERINDRTCRITGVSLPSAAIPADAVGTIGLASSTGAPPNIILPSDLGAAPYSYQGSAVSLPASIHVTLAPVTTGGFTNLPPSISKAGLTLGTFRISITNTNTGAVTQELEIYVTFLGGGRVTQPSVVAP